MVDYPARKQEHFKDSGASLIKLVVPTLIPHFSALSPLSDVMSSNVYTWHNVLMHIWPTLLMQK